MANNATLPSNNDKQPSDQTLNDSKDLMALFESLQALDIDQLVGKDVTSVLPFLAGLLLSPSFVKRQQLLELVYSNKKMNNVIQLMLAGTIEPGDLVNPPQILFFESSQAIDKLRIVAAEYIRIQDLARQSTFNQNTGPKLIQSDLFDNPIYLDDVSYCLYTLLCRPTTISIINILDMAEALLYLKHGSTFIVRLVGNMPDRCQEVCQSLVTYGDRQDEGAGLNEVSDQRAKTLRLLCTMNPSIALTVRSLTLQLCKMPSLTIMITLDQMDKALDKYETSISQPVTTNSGNKVRDVDVDLSSRAVSELENSYDSAVAFMTGILLGLDDSTRTWFSQYTKSAQQKRIDQSHYTVLSRFRSQLINYMNILFPPLLEEDLIVDQPKIDAPGNSVDQSRKTKLREQNAKLIRATATLRLFCAFRGIGSLKLNSNESDILLRLITCKPMVNQTTVNFATTGVCTLLACSALINNQKEEKRAAEWLRWLIKESNYSDNRYSSHGKCSISELLLLIAIHFQNNQNNQIAELVCATLGMKLQIKASVSKCKSLFVQEVFNDQMVAEHAVRVPVTKNLNNNITEFLPVHCIHQLLESRSFSKHQVPIKDWIYQQICQSKKPIHHILPKLIEAYVNSVIVSTSIHGHCGTNQPIPEEDISRIFETQLYSIERNVNPTIVENGFNDTIRPERKKIKKETIGDPSNTSNELSNCNATNEQPIIVDVEAAQVLLLYYLVLYEDIRLKKNADLSATERAKLIKYSPDFMMDIPVFYLLQLVRDNQSSFGAILPDLLKLVTSQYPQLCSIQHWLTMDHYKSYTSSGNRSLDHETCLGESFMATLKKEGNLITSRSPKVNLVKQLADSYKNIETDKSSLVRTVNQVLALPKEEVWPFVQLFIENFFKIVNLSDRYDTESEKLVHVTTKLWWKFNTIFPRKLWVMTVNALKRPQSLRSSVDVRPVEYSWDELALDPLIVLRCDGRVFRCVDILNIVLHILSAFLAASRRCLQDQINEQPNRQKDVRNLDELRTTLILAQTSAAIQILLESCIPSENEQEALNKREIEHELDNVEESLLKRFDASVNSVCEHLHQVFIADTNLAKLVHFQTYPSELLATTSDKIPSMHICLDFIPELLSQPDLTKQVFVIELTSHLCEKYAITKSLNVAKLCFNVAYTLLQLLPSERRAHFFIPVLPALQRICNIFPILREDAGIILSQIQQITLAHMASTSSRLSLGSAKPFEGLEKMSWREVRKLMKRFSLHEALYLCIQKCSLDLVELKDSRRETLCSQQNHNRQPAYSTIFAYGNHVINPASNQS